MFLENVFPPIPSEVIMPAAGFAAGQGRLSLIGVIVAGTVGSVAGALFWYYVGKWIGADRLRRWAGRHGRWLTLAPKDIDRVDRWFDQHSGKAVFLGRLVPALRTLISVPAGVFGGDNTKVCFAYASQEHEVNGLINAQREGQTHRT